MLIVGFPPNQQNVSPEEASRLVMLMLRESRMQTGIPREENRDEERQ